MSGERPGKARRQSLRTFLDQLRTDHPTELVQVKRGVSSHYERSAIVKSLEPFGAPAVYFEKVDGREMPVVAGIFGTRARIADALGVSVADCVDYVLNASEHLREPKHVATGPAQEVRRIGADVDLQELPIGRHSRGDGGEYITSAVGVVRDPASGNLNTGMYRLMVTGPRTLTVNAAQDHDLGRIISDAAAVGRSVEIAIAIGHHPAFPISSQLEPQSEVDSYAAAATLLGGAFAVAPALTIDLPIPADAEIVLEGRIDTTSWRPEGPFGEFTYYHGSASAPQCEITAMTRRADAIFHDLHPTHSEHRCLWLFPSQEARLLGGLRSAGVMAERVHIPSSAAGLSAYIALAVRRAGDSQSAILAAIALSHFLKMVVVVDQDIDVTDQAQVAWAVAVHFQAARDLLVIPIGRGIRTDPSAETIPGSDPPQFVTSKLGLDATRRIGGVPPFPPRADLPVDELAGLSPRDYVADDVFAEMLADQARRLRADI